ncbi:MAG: sodium:solute symporter family protein [Candidatus Mycalebacterium zealandia]|nr:MAG: sodium:solute symporter family protein [Candidatus Mycalebacterium zealandia]
MSKGTTFIAVAFVYIAVLITLALVGNRKNKGDEKEFFLAGGNLGTIIGFLTFFATLYSTFILIGMPNFFRVHGVGTWIFLGVTDMALAVFTLWLCFKLKDRIASKDFRSMSDLIRDSFGGWGVVVYVMGLVIFLIPYIAIQIKGASGLLSAIVPYSIPQWGWALIILVLMFLYSSIGGLRGIMYCDALQGIMLFSVIWIMAAVVLSKFGGLGPLFQAVAETDERLLSVPGPKGLLSTQWLIAGFISIVLLPVSQPQLTSRLSILKGVNERRKVPVLHASFTFLLLIAGLIIGLYGAVAITANSGPEFIGKLILEQNAVIGAIALIGILAAAMSTSDSQFFALGSEINNALGRISEKLKISAVVFVKFIILIFCAAAFAVAMKSSQGIISLAISGFMGTALMAPMVMASTLIKERKLSTVIPAITAASLVFFLLSLFGVTPKIAWGLRTDLLLLAFNSAATILIVSSDGDS